MKELLLSKGFVFNDYDYKVGNFYEYEDETSSDESLRIAKILGYNGEKCTHVFVCCNDKFTEFESFCVIDDEASDKKYSKDEFELIVSQM